MNKGNGAREKVNEFFEKIYYENADYFLMWLAVEGFVIVPLETASDEEIVQ
jgi:hypothetical protein